MKTFIIIILLLLMAGCSNSNLVLLSSIDDNLTASADYTYSSQKITQLINNIETGGGSLNIITAKNTTVAYSSDQINNITDNYGDGDIQFSEIVYSGDKIVAVIVNTTLSGVSTLNVTNLTYTGDVLTFVEYS